MRLLEKMCFVVLASGLALGQATAPNSGSAQSGSVSDDLKALREAISQQQQQIAQQQQQLQALQQKLDEKNSTKQACFFEFLSRDKLFERDTYGRWHTARCECITEHHASIGNSHHGAGNREERISAFIPHRRNGVHARWIR